MFEEEYFHVKFEDDEKIKIIQMNLKKIYIKEI